MTEEEIIRLEAKEFYSDFIENLLGSNVEKQVSDLRSKLHNFYTKKSKIVFLRQVYNCTNMYHQEHINNAHGGKSNPKCEIDIGGKKILFYIRQEIEVLSKAIFKTTKENKINTNQPKKTIKIFVSYSSRETNLRKLLVEGVEKHLKHNRKFEYMLWTDEGIDVGQDWKSEIDNALLESEAAILLVSSNFCSSAFIEDVELTHFFKEKGYLILPVLVRKFDISSHEKLSKLNFFKTYNHEYGFNNRLEKNDLLPFDKLGENDSIPDGILEEYFLKLANYINTAISNRF